MTSLRPTRAIVDLDALAHNYHAIERSLLYGCCAMPVVKADAYGHGAAWVARKLEREGATHFAVAVVEEGAELRRNGVGSDVLVMGWIGPDQLPELRRHRLIANVHSPELLADLDAFTRAQRVRLRVHLKLDTGMTRLGLLPADLPAALEALQSSPWLEVAGVFQNFASADDLASEQTTSQARRFAEMVRAVLAAGFTPKLHNSNSAATLAPPPWAEDLPPASYVRPGLSLYTRFPGLSGDEIRDVMTFASVVDQVKRVPPGSRVGYGGSHRTTRETAVAIVPAGYADGVPRHLSNVGRVLVNGRRCPILGRVSMDLTAVDVTDLDPPARRGDAVAFFGAQGDARLGVEECAAAAGTVSWELLCGVGPRVPRVIVESGRPSRVVSRFFTG